MINLGATWSLSVSLPMIVFEMIKGDTIDTDVNQAITCAHSMTIDIIDVKIEIVELCEGHKVPREPWGVYDSPGRPKVSPASAPLQVLLLLRTSLNTYHYDMPSREVVQCQVNRTIHMAGRSCHDNSHYEDPRRTS